MRFFFFILFFLIFLNNSAQNLIFNGSFELLDSSCVYSRTIGGSIGPNQSAATNIYSAKGTADILNECALINANAPLDSQISVPYSMFGYQYARTGKGTTAFFIDGYQPFTNKLSTELTSLIISNKLAAGKKYCFSFYTIRSNLSGYATDAIEAILSPDSFPIIQDSLSYNSIISNINKGFITDTLNWIYLSDTIIATGYEKYIHIGKFHNISSSNVQYVSYTNSWFYQLLTYYLDDVSLYPCDTIAPKAVAGNDTLICKGDSAYIGGHNYADYYYSWWHDSICGPNGSTEIQRDEHLGKIWVSPTVSKWYYVQATDFKFHKTLDSVFVSVLPCTCIKKDTALCQGNSYVLGNGDAFYNVFNWWPVAHLDNPQSATPIASPNTSMWFYVTASDTLGGSIYDSLFISVLNCNPTINDTTICTGADIIIGNGNPLYKSWIWTPSTFLNNQTIAQPTASPTYNITYYVSAVDSFGNIDDDTVSINVIDCDTIGAPELFIPNAFTPNTDGINDVFIYGNHELFTDIKTLIYNQWGELIFSSNIYIPWSGKFKGEFVQNGMYIYYITAVLKSTGKQQVYKGNVMVLY